MGLTVLGGILVLILLAAIIAAVASRRREHPAARPVWMTPRLLCWTAFGVTLIIGAFWSEAIFGGEPDSDTMAWLLISPIVATALPAVTAAWRPLAAVFAWLGGLGLVIHVALFALSFGALYVVPAVLLLAAAVMLTRGKPSEVISHERSRTS